MINTASFQDLLARVHAAVPDDYPVYLVGGAVRDMLMNRPTHDLDFVLSGPVLDLSRQVANALQAAYYPLDEARQTARVVMMEADGQRQILDFALLRGPDLEADLRARDFTINAMAVELSHLETLIDPLGGLSDLRARRIRACSPASMSDDSLRTLRGVRQATAFQFQIVPETQQQIRQAAGQLPQVSPERLRDEIFRILEGPRPATALRVLDVLGVLGYVLPELEGLKGTEQSPPHVNDVWNHTLDVTSRLDDVLDVLRLEHDPDRAASFALGLLSMRLGRFREQLYAHLGESLSPLRSLRGLLMLAALYHDIGKPVTRQEETGERVRFYQHEQVGARIAAERAETLRLSNQEVDRLALVVRHHMRPLLLTQSPNGPSRRAIYRFFRDTGAAGVDICLLSLADTLGTYGSSLPQIEWVRLLDVVRALLEAWWERSDEVVAPPPLINGHDLMQIFELQAGPQIGQLLDAVREAQATGQVQDRQEALDLVQARLTAQQDGC